MAVCTPVWPKTPPRRPINLRRVLPKPERQFQCWHINLGKVRWRVQHQTRGPYMNAVMPQPGGGRVGRRRHPHRPMAAPLSRPHMIPACIPALLLLKSQHHTPKNVLQDMSGCHGVPAPTAAVLGVVGAAAAPLAAPRPPVTQSPAASAADVSYIPPTLRIIRKGRRRAAQTCQPWPPQWGDVTYIYIYAADASRRPGQK